MKKKLVIGVSTLVVLLVLFLSLPWNIHFIRALVYTTPGIEDVDLFQADTVTPGVYTPWKIAREYNKPIPPTYVDRFKALKTVAFCVVKDSAIVSEQYWDGYDSDSLANIFSVTKSIVSLLVGKAIEEGSIESVDDAVIKYIPEFNHDGNDKITIRNLLTMSSGLDWAEGQKNLFGAITKLYYGDDLDKFVVSLKRKEEPGKRFEYESCNTQILGLLLERATGEKLSSYAETRLWRLIGTKSNALWSIDDKKAVKAFCCFNTNTRELARLGQFILQKGNWQGRQVIDSDYIDMATAIAPGMKKNDSDEPNDNYGFQFWITKYDSMKVVYARGILGQYVIMIPEKHVVIVRLGKSRTEHLVNGHPDDLYLWIEAGLAIAR